MSSPGTIPASSRLPMDTRDKVPRMMAMALGGMIMAMPPVPKIGPRVMDLL